MTTDTARALRSARKIAGKADTAIELREEWLATLATAILLEIKDRCPSLIFPSVRVTCGFPSRGGELGRSKRAAGQCWAAEASEDKHAEIFISPVEADAENVAAILTHELVHAALPGDGHRKPFQAAMKALGHKAPFTASIATDDFWGWCRPLLDVVGPYPHAVLHATRPVAAPKKQTARMLKAVCEREGCGYTVRLAKKWIVEVGPPICPKHGVAMAVEGLAELDEDGPGDDED